MSQKSSLPQPAESVSRVLTADTFEPKANDWGWLDGKPVAMDYANLDKDTPVSSLILKRDKFSRSSDQWKDEDCSIIARSRGAQITRSDAAPQTSPALHLRSGLESQLPH
jgi:hypothetical protein